MEVLLYILIAVGLINLMAIFLTRSNKNASLNSAMDAVNAGIKELSQDFRDEFRANREETAGLHKANREELGNSIQTFSEANVLQLDKINNQIKENLQELTGQQKTEAKEGRDSLKSSLVEFQDSFDRSVKSFNDLQRQKFTQLEDKQKVLIDGTEKKLEEMKTIVDEKLQKTLNERLSQSFETVGKQLQAVQEGLGEMKNLATDVGGLKKVLSNVKMRGGIGEVQLAMLLEQILAPDQYEANVKTKQNSSGIVEFAIKLPGREDADRSVWLPIDAKFPKDVYEQLQDAYEVGDLGKIEAAQKNMDNAIKKMAKDINEKYLDPPNTTDFGIMFLPFEGMYAEVVRKAALFEELQRNYKIIVTGPSTLAAILNSLQMGFRTLAIQKRSSEVWEVLGAVKTEFGKFGGMMEKAQNNIQTGLNQLDDVMGKRTRAIERKLRSVEALSEANTQKILPEANEIIEDFDEE